PQPPAQRRVDRGAAGLAHARGAVVEDHVVHQQVAEDHEVLGHQRAGRRKARASARTRARSMGFDQRPPRFTEDPTISASAAAYAATLSAVTPDPTSVGIETASATARTSAGSVGRPVAVPVTITPSARKNSAASAVSTTSRSAVIA